MPPRANTRSSAIAARDADGGSTAAASQLTQGPSTQRDEFGDLNGDDAPAQAATVDEGATERDGEDEGGVGDEGSDGDMDEEVAARRPGRHARALPALQDCTTVPANLEDYSLNALEAELRSRCVSCGNLGDRDKKVELSARLSALWSLTTKDANVTPDEFSKERLPTDEHLKEITYVVTVARCARACVCGSARVILRRERGEARASC